jgi:hypothetical protein
MQIFFAVRLLRELTSVNDVMSTLHKNAPKTTVYSVERSCSCYAIT